MQQCVHHADQKQKEESTNVDRPEGRAAGVGTVQLQGEPETEEHREQRPELAVGQKLDHWGADCVCAAPRVKSLL